MNSPTTLAEARRVFPPVWVIYERPRDYPEGFVVRVHYGLFPERACSLVPSLIEARQIAVAAGASVRLDRMPEDDGPIVETWL